MYYSLRIGSFSAGYTLQRCQVGIINARPNRPACELHINLETFYMVLGS